MLQVYFLSSLADQDLRQQQLEAWLQALVRDSNTSCLALRK